MTRRQVKQCTLGSKESDARQAVELLKNHFAEGRALTQNAKELAHELQLMGAKHLLKAYRLVRADLR